MLNGLRWKIILLFAELLAPHCADAEVIGTWFSPRGGCTEAIVDTFNKAEKSIDVQVYNFTSEPIANALIKAAERKVPVRIIVDKRAAAQKWSQAARCAASGCKVWLDGSHPIAHNKAAVVDGRLLLNGSFNYSRSAEYNAENLYLENGKATVQKYVENFDLHLQHSKPLRAAK